MVRAAVVVSVVWYGVVVCGVLVPVVSVVDSMVDSVVDSVDDITGDVEGVNGVGDVEYSVLDSVVLSAQGIGGTQVVDLSDSVDKVVGSSGMFGPVEDAVYDTVVDSVVVPVVRASVVDSSVVDMVVLL